MLQISLETANVLYLWGWRVSVAAGILTALSLTALFVGTGIRDHDAEKQFSALNVAAASSRERAAKAELALAQLARRAGPRFIPTSEYVEALRPAKKLKLRIIYLRDDGEALGLAMQFFGVFHELGWQVEVPQVAVRKPGTHEQIGSLLSYNAQARGGCADVCWIGSGDKDFPALSMRGVLKAQAFRCANPLPALCRHESLRLRRSGAVNSVLCPRNSLALDIQG